MIPTAPDYTGAAPPEQPTAPPPYDSVNSRPATPSSAVPQWRLPAGVTRGMWDYAQAEHIAYEYDDYHAFNSLFDFDEAVLARHFDKPGVLVDLGCGAGRLLVPFARRGFRGVAVDLSLHMLAVVGDKARLENLPIDRVCANLAELNCLADGMADYAICMFSTLGMIRGRAVRRQALAHARRILKPGGKFVMHVHNRWYNLFDPQGRKWLLSNWLGAALKRDREFGDKVFPYRAIPNMFLHVFTKRELQHDLRAAGFRILETISLDTERRHALRWPWCLARLRANGWIVVCTPA